MSIVASPHPRRRAPPPDPDLAAARAAATQRHDHLATVARDAADRVQQTAGAEMQDIAEGMVAAESRLLAARTYADGLGTSEADMARREALAEHDAAGQALADLALLLRYAIHYRRDWLRVQLEDIVAGILADELPDALAALVGGHISASPNDTMAALKTRLFSAEARGLRVILFDNLKTLKFSWDAALPSLLFQPADADVFLAWAVATGRATATPIGVRMARHPEALAQLCRGAQPDLN